MPIRNQKLVVYFLIFLSVFLLLFSRQGFVNPLEFQVVETVSWPLRLILAPLNEAKKLIFYHRIYGEYVKARKEAETLRHRIVAMEELVKENNRLNHLLDVKRKALFSTTTANIIMRDPSDWNAALVIDRGTDDGIEVGMPVVNALGVVGKIAEVSRRKAKVILLTDPSFSVAVVTQRSRQAGLVSGSLSRMCRLRYLGDHADVQKGDMVITSKFSSSFPEGLLIGEITNVYPAGTFPQTECLVRPAVDFSQLEEVLVVKNLE